MQCPLKANRLGFFDNCNKEKCVWWLSEQKQCAVVVLVISLAQLAESRKGKL